MQYRHAALGGTFDRIHIGHEALLLRAFALADDVTIGLTTDEYVAARKPVSPDEDDRQSYAVRKVKLEEWLHAHRLLERAHIVPLTDTFGPTVVSDVAVAPGSETDAAREALLDRKVSQQYDLLVVSSETAPVADTINRKRSGQGLAALAVEVVPMVLSEDGIPVSSTRERHGSIDDRGTLIMPAPLKIFLSKPLGPVISNETLPTVVGGDRGKRVVAVGDEIATKLVTYGLIPSLTVIDRHSRRVPYDWEAEALAKLTEGAVLQTLTSGPGYISADAVSAIGTWAASGTRTLLTVVGEEDLLTLPVIHHAPWGTVVYYGQPGEGAVRVVVDDTSRHIVRGLLEKFLPQTSVT